MVRLCALTAIARVQFLVRTLANGITLNQIESTQILIIDYIFITDRI